MASNPQDDDRPATTVKTMEIVVAALIVAGGILVMVDSVRLGNRWASDGPQAGYFPFYIGVMLCVSGILNMVFALREPGTKSFVSRGQAKQVMLVLLPLIVYIGLIEFLGIYVASSLYIAVFMVWLGKYRWLKTTIISVGVSLAFFLMFEVWFKVPLIKGPLETALGLN